MNATDPPRQVTLVRKAGICGDFGQARSSLPNTLDRSLQAQVHDVAVRRHADGSGKHAVEMEGTSTRKFRKCRDFYLLRKMSHDVALIRFSAHVPRVPRARLSGIDV